MASKTADFGNNRYLYSRKDVAKITGFKAHKAGLEKTTPAKKATHAKKKTTLSKNNATPAKKKPMRKLLSVL